MKPDRRFLNMPKDFWAYVRLISEYLGYTDRGTHQIKVPSFETLVSALRELGLDTGQILSPQGKPYDFGKRLHTYFAFRASLLNEKVKPLLMDAAQAKVLFNQVRKQLRSGLFIPLNKQKGKKKQPAYLTGLVNMLVHDGLKGVPCEYDPRKLTRITKNGRLVRTLARRIDGAFPSVVDPIAIWEIKEYYHTTTFGSRVADGVYETLLDGMELEELKKTEGIEIKHYLILDAYYTWWDCGRSYLCRVVDMLHMGYVDEVVFGREVIERLPLIVKEWKQFYRAR